MPSYVASFYQFLQAQSLTPRQVISELSSRSTTFTFLLPPGEAFDWLEQFQEQHRSYDEDMIDSLLLHVIWGHYPFQALKTIAENGGCALFS